MNIQVQIEMRGPAFPLQPFYPQRRQLVLDLGLADVGLMVEHHLEQRVVAQAALGLQGLHQLFERQVLVGLRLQRPLPGLLHHLRDAHLPVNVGLEHLGVDEEADQALGFTAVAVGDRHADADVFLAAVAVQQGLERSQQQHEQSHALLLGQDLEVVGERGRQFDRQACATVALHRRARVVERQLQHALLTAEPVAPVVQLAILLARLHPTALPHGVIGVLERQRRQCQGVTLAVSRVVLHQFLDHQLHRPAIGDDVMLHQHQHMLIGGQAQQADAQQRPLLQVEGLGDLGFYPGLQRSFIDIGACDGQRHLRFNHLNRALALLAQGGAQAFMTGQQGVETALQRRAVKLAFQAQRAGDVVRRAVRLQLPEKPLALLGIRQRQRLVAPGRQQGRGFRGGGIGGRQGSDKACQTRLLEQRLERDFQVQGLANARDHLHGQQGMPAQFKEMMGQADTLDAKDIGPDRRDLLLQRRDRCQPCLLCRAADGCRQGLAVELAVGVQGHALEEDQVRRHHVIGQLLAQGGLELFGGAHLLRLGQWLRRHQIGHQLIVGGQHESLTDVILGQQQRLDFTQLDTEPTDLHLVIDAADVFDHPVGAITRHVAGAIKTLAQAAERIGDKALGGQARALQVSTRQAAGTGDVEFAHGADRQQVEVAVQHIQRPPRQRAANRAGAAADHPFVGAAIEHAGHHRGLGRPVGVEQPHMPQPGPAPHRRAVQGHGFAADMHLAQGPVRPWPRRQAIVQEQFPVSRRQVGQGDALIDDLPVQVGAVPQLRAAQHHGGAQGQRRVQLLDEAVEVQGGELQHPILWDQARIVGRDVGELTQRRVADGNALGFAGGARGVDHVGQALRLDVERRSVFGIRRQRRVGQVDIQAGQRPGQRQALTQVRLSQHQAHATVLEHMHQALARILRVKRHVGTARLEHRQQADHHGKGTLDGDTDQAVRADPLVDQVVRQTIGLAVQFAIAERLLIQGQRLAFRMLAGLGLEPVVYGLCDGDAGRRVPILEHRLLLRTVEHRQRAKTAARRTHQRLEQVLPMLRKALDGRRLEQVGGVGQRGPQAFSGFMGVQAQVEMGGLVVPVQFCHAQAGQVLAVTAGLGVGLVVEHHLEQRVVAQAAFRLQRHHQLFERQVLVRLGLQGTMLGLLQQFGKRHLPVEVGLEHLGVDEKANQPLGFDAVAVGIRYADANIRLAAVAKQQGLERRQQEHERRHAFLLRQALEARHQVRLQLHLQARAAMALLRGARVIEGQFQHGLLTAQQVLPVRQLAGPLPGLHPVALPQRVVGVLDRQARQAKVLALTVGGIQLHQFLDHHLHRPAIGNDVVLHHHQHMLIFRQLQQGHAQQRPLLQIERAGDLGFDPRHQLRLVNNLLPDLDTRLGLDGLQQLLTVLDQPGAQAFVARQQAVEAALQRRQVQAPLQAQCAGDVVGGAVRVQLPQEPLALLGIGQRQALAILADRSNRQLGEAHATALQALVKLLALFQRQAKKARNQIDIRVGTHGSNRL